MTALLDEIRAEIAAEGPITLARYMTLALQHPRHGYYVTRDPLGAAGDFTTAPEISQMFGEMLGLWAAQVWAHMGAPAPVLLVELGPGRGTLMADMLRAARALPAFREALRVHLVETSPALRARQRAALSGVDVSWHEDLDTVPDGPLLLIANEFLDALAIRQFEARGGRWFERLVGMEASGKLTLGLARESAPAGIVPARFDGAPDGAVFEIAPAREALATRIAERLGHARGAALLIDYGHARSGLGDTFQAVARHAYADPFAEPGAADLTSHVDFEAIVRVAREAGAAIHGPMAQGAFLLDLGIQTRAARLASGKDKASRTEIATALDRLTAPAGMGTLFQVLALTSPGLPAPPPFG